MRSYMLPESLFQEKFNVIMKLIPNFVYLLLCEQSLELHIERASLACPGRSASDTTVKTRDAGTPLGRVLLNYILSQI